MIDWNKCRIKAREILEKYNIATPAAVDVFDIAQNEGINIIFFNPNDATNEISGFFEDKSKTIYLNVDDSTERQAYTVAHELGHYFLGHTPGQYGVLLRQALYETPKEDIEKEADTFASELLMPKKLLELAMTQYKLGFDDVVELAQLFGVSQSAMRYRLENMRVHDR